MRISRAELFKDMATLMAKRSTCQRLNVGAIAVFDNRVICSSYNGPPSGEAHCSSYVCDLHKHCTRSIHAEANLIYFAAKHGIKLEGSTLYLTHSPCSSCCDAIVQAGIKEVIFLEYFRETDHLHNKLKKRGIKFYHYTDEKDPLHSS